MKKTQKNGQKPAKFAKNLQKTTFYNKNGRILAKFSEKTAKIAKKTSKNANFGQKLTKIGKKTLKNAKNRQILTETDKKLPKFAEKSQNLVKNAQKTEKSDKIAKNLPKDAKKGETTLPGLRLFNTLTGRIESFRPGDRDNVKIYTCGPTVYGHQHIGNYASYIYWDLLLRTLRACGFTPRRVLNLTDVGHLTSDGDAGEDKMEKGARAVGKTVWEVAEFYTRDFLDSYRALNLLQPDVLTRATDFIEADLRLVDKLTKKGYTYKTTDGIYFDTAKFPRYAEFARLDLDHLKAGARVEMSSEKRHPADFAVWKFIAEGEDHAMRWRYRGRDGYPGWHLECSTIIHEVLGEPIDIHTGGIDHIPVHHTNEIAQSEGAFGKKLARFWLHCNFLTINGEKISKSLGNILTLSDLRAHGYSPLDFKMWVLQGHFQSERNFTFADLAGAHSRRLAWRNRIALLQQTDAKRTGSDFFATRILPAVAENLNSAEAFALIDGGELGLGDWKKADALFGLELLASAPGAPAEVKKLLAEREVARAKRDFQTADALRHELEIRGFAVLDTDAGPKWQYLN